METKEEANCKMFRKLCIELSHNTPLHKLKQLKFLLQDRTSEINDINDEKSFLDLINKLDAVGILSKKSPGKDEALLLSELFHAVSLPILAVQICSKFDIERGIIMIIIN